ncbi:MAG: radical SAM protein [Ignavibacteria bacterium]|nr:MAG: radical SAM protein [Ignavibacteria bacterium]
MSSPVFLTGRRKAVYNQYIKLRVFLHFLGEAITGKLPWKGFPGFLDRLLYFLAKMKENKYVTTQGTTKINLYVPGFPSAAFFKACRKVSPIGEKQPCISVLLSVTSGCRFRCEHCYQKHDRGKDVPIDDLVDVVRQLDAMGVAFFNIEGGDPFLAYDRLKAACAAVTTGEIMVNSTGDGITCDRLEELRELNVRGVMFSLHAPDEEDVNSFMGRDNAWDTMLEGIACCHNVGMDVTFNTCMLRNAFYDGTFDRVMDRAHTFGASLIQLIKPKPSGAWLGEDVSFFSPSDLAHVEKLVRTYNNDPKYAHYPFIAAQIHDERADMFGCTAGGTDRFYINAKGDVQPCEFLNISYGNIQNEPFEQIFRRMRESFDMPGDRWLCESCAPEIHRLHQESGSPSLPLSEELSARVHENCDRGACPDFYHYVDVRHRTSATNGMSS